jgi:transcriptional regulator with XRE-family HTH domain
MSRPTLNFEAERRNRGLSLKQMAKAVGISKSTWARLEKGDTLSAANSLKVAEYFDLTVTEIWPLPTSETAAAA